MRFFRQLIPEPKIWQTFTGDDLFEGGPRVCAPRPLPHGLGARRAAAPAAPLVERFDIEPFSDFSAK